MTTNDHWDWGFGIPHVRAVQRPRVDAAGNNSTPRPAPLPRRIIGNADVAQMYEEQSARFRSDMAPTHGKVISDLYERMAIIHRLTPDEALNVLIYINAICEPITMTEAFKHKNMPR